MFLSNLAMAISKFLDPKNDVAFRTVDNNTGVIKSTENSYITVNSTVTVEYTQNTPPEPITSAKLLNELGRRTVDEALFCTGVENGEL
jgi:hypothetical protein